MIEPGQVAPHRKRLGLSQSELARRSGVSQSFIAKMEAGLIDPAFSKMHAISSVLEAIEGTNRGRTAAELMNPHVFVLMEDDTIEKAVMLIVEHGISQIPVMKGGRVQGTVTESSFIEFVIKHRGNPEAFKMPIRDVMEDPLPLVGRNEKEEHLVSLLMTFPAVLVMENHEILGIVTKSDLLRTK
jgi:predicted transcriptional regulator